MNSVRMESNTVVSSQRFSSDDHAGKILQELNRFRDSQCFSDIVVVVDNKEFKAHRAILAASSPYFLAMLTCGLSEGLSTRIEINDVKASVFQEILNFIYSGVITIQKDIVQETLVAADMLQIEGVVNACCKFILELLNPENCIGVLLFAESYNCHDLARKAEAYIYNNFLKVVGTEEYLELCKDDLVKCLRSENLKITCEVEVLEAAIKWLHHDVVRRREFAAEVLGQVRLALVRIEEMEPHLQKTDDAKLREIMQGMFNNAALCRKTIHQESGLGAAHDHVLPRIYARKSVYVIGGFNRDAGKRWSDSCALACGERYDFADRKWHRLPPMKYARNAHGVVVLDGLILSICGESEGMLFNNVEVFDPIDLQWSFSAVRMPECVCIMGVCAFEESAFLFGGLREVGASDSVDKYCLERKSFQPYAKMSSRRCAMGVASHKGLIYVIGGKSELDPASELATLESFNPVTKEWCQLADLSTRRAFLSAVVLGNYLYAIGGTDEYGCSLSSVERYDFEEDTWEEVENMGTARAALSAATVNGQIVVVGGRSSGDELIAPGTYNSTEWYCPETGVWSPGESMHMSRCEAGIAIL